MKVNHRRAVERARKALDREIAAIYALAPNGHTKFFECLALADTMLAARYELARRTLIDAEQAAIDAGKAYRGAFGALTWTERRVKSIGRVGLSR